MNILREIINKIINESWNIFSKNFIPIFINNCFNKYTQWTYLREIINKIIMVCLNACVILFSNVRNWLYIHISQ